MNPDNTARSALYIWAVIILCVMAVTAMLILAVFKPGDTSTGTLILGVLGPVIAAFLAAAIQGVHLAVNGRLTDLLEKTAQANRAEGKIEGVAETRRARREDISAAIVVPATDLSDRQ